MTDTIVQEVRDARAAIAAEFDYDLGKYLSWIRGQTEARKMSLRKASASKTAKTSTAGKRRARPAHA